MTRSGWALLAASGFILANAAGAPLAWIPAILLISYGFGTAIIDADKED